MGILGKMGRKCKRGFGCGRTCISRTKVCRSNVDASGKKIIENFTQQLLRLSGVAGTGGGLGTPKIKPDLEVEELAPELVGTVSGVRTSTPKPRDLISLGRRMAEGLTDPGSGKLPPIKDFTNLRNDLLNASTLSREEILANVEISDTVEEGRRADIEDALVGAAQLTNTVPRENFRIFNDRRNPRAYAQDSITMGERAEVMKGINSIASDPQERLNLLSRYYKEDENIFPNINVGEYEVQDIAVTYHEFSHHVEFANRDIAQANLDWLKERASGKVEQLNKLIPGSNYEDDEVAYTDKFISPYVGKLYTELIEAGTPTSEVLSMGFQFFKNGGAMRQLYKLDQEHFFLVLGTLGILRGEQ